MKKMIVITVVGVLLGLAGAVSMVVAREKQARALAVAAAVDSAAVHGDSAQAAHGDSAHAETAQPDSTRADSTSVAAAVEHEEDAHAPVDSGAGRATGRSSEDSLSTQVRDASGADGSAGEQRLARIFAAMRPEQAAKVLEQMTDPEVRLLLSRLGERQAAAIMSSISPERAAVISSALIRSGRSTP